MKKEYMTWLMSGEDLPEGREIEISIRDLTPGQHKYSGRNVRAIVSRSAQKLPDGDVLWIRSGTGRLRAQPWAIKIVADLGEFLSRKPFDYASLLGKKE